MCVSQKGQVANRKLWPALLGKQNKKATRSTIYREKEKRKTVRIYFVVLVRPTKCSTTAIHGDSELYIITDIIIYVFARKKY